MCCVVRAVVFEVVVVVEVGVVDGMVVADTLVGADSLLKDVLVGSGLRLGCWLSTLGTP